MSLTEIVEQISDLASIRAYGVKDFAKRIRNCILSDVHKRGIYIGEDYSIIVKDNNKKCHL